MNGKQIVEQLGDEFQLNFDVGTVTVSATGKKGDDKAGVTIAQKGNRLEADMTAHELENLADYLKAIAEALKP